MRPNRQQRGFSLIELLIVIAIILIIVTVALPRLNKARVYAQEMAAQKAVQTISTAQVEYNSQFGRFAQSLTELGPPASGAESAAAAGLISADLASGEKQGYRFTVTATPTGYAISAVPISFGATGSRTFFADQTMDIHYNDGQEPASANSPIVGKAAAKASDSTK
jgi:prepilin-type N-terminal cleavage/methylation domain-containing protein